MKSPFLPLFGLIVVTACGPKSGPPDNPDLRSNMPARSTVYYVEHRAELADMEKVCAAWQGSQRPIASWPAVVTGNCNSANAARTSIHNQSEIDKLRKEAGA